MVFVDTETGTTLPICSGQTPGGVDGDIESCQLEFPRALLKLGDTIYISTYTSSETYAIMKLEGLYQKSLRRYPIYICSINVDSRVQFISNARKGKTSIHNTNIFNSNWLATWSALKTRFGENILQKLWSSKSHIEKPNVQSEFKFIPSLRWLVDCVFLFDDFQVLFHSDHQYQFHNSIMWCSISINFFYQWFPKIQSVLP